ncbi:SDR family oxidoreductase [Agrococcus sp. DT81.2]|uniref:SDR family oxidoreductase n=1 Tax=Agrococcus sp. DT81.2 TaxID=3393414 RepID=UPI003CE4C858
MRVVVVGGSGNAGAAIVRALGRRGAQAVPMSRSGKAIAGAPGVRADIVSGEGLDAALDGADAVVDASNSRNPLDLRPFTIGARNVVAAAERASVGRAVLLSILGVERSKLQYHRKKHEQELTYLGSSMQVCIVRAAQFHEWSVDFFETGAAVGAIPVFLGGRLQPVDVGEVADLVADEATAPSGEQIIDFAGPQVRVSRELARAWQSATGARGHIVNGPFPPSMLDYLRSGANLTEQRKGRVTFEEWLARRR